MGFKIANKPSFKANGKTGTTDKSDVKLGPIELSPPVIYNTPTMDAFDDIHFDYCDGLRIKFPEVKAGAPNPEYKLYIVEHELGTVIFNGDIKVSDNSVYSQQKYYTAFDFTLIRKKPLDEDFVNKLIKEYGIDSVKVLQIYTVCMNNICNVTKSKKSFYSDNCVASAEHKKYDSIITDICDYMVANHAFTHKFNLAGKEVITYFPVGTIGDSIGWFSYAERFQQKHKCKLICVMADPFIELFKNQYPNIKFMNSMQLAEAKCKPYASYQIGLFFKDNTTHQPYDFKYSGNHRTASKILGVSGDDIAPRVDLSAPRQIKQPYVCIAVQASGHCKLWNNPFGWHDVIKHLTEIGYRVLCIDKDYVSGTNNSLNFMPAGAEDFTGNFSLQERVDLLHHCDFFIGLSSGVSWLAWTAQCPVVMISGFTNPENEFYTPYRVINTFACHGCWNDAKCEFDHTDYMWCPRHKGTDKAYECSRLITAEQVLNTIAKIPAYQTMYKKYNTKRKKGNK